MKINFSKWMEKIDDGTNLLSLDLPGAHDAVTNHVQLSPMARCQDKDIYSLLAMGIRVLDIRVDIRKNTLVLVHANAKALISGERGARQLEMSDIIAEIRRFLSENPSETVIMQFKNDSELKMEDSFDLLYNRHIASDKRLWYTENRVPSLGEVRGKIVLLRRCEMYLTNKPYAVENAGIDLSRWIDQDRRIPKPLVLRTFSERDDEFLIQDRYRYTARERWALCLEPFLDARTPFKKQYIICFTSTAGGIIVIPERNAKYINEKFLAYPLDKEKYYGIIYFDFPTQEIVRKVIENNEQLIMDN